MKRITKDKEGNILAIIEYTEISGIFFIKDEVDNDETIISQYRNDYKIERHINEITGFDYTLKFDKNNNLIYYFENYCSNEEFYEYDENNNLIHFKDYKGYEFWYEYLYDEKKFYYRDIDGNSSYGYFDDNYNIIYKYNNIYDIETWYEYDENNNLIHYKNSDGDEEWYEYED